MPYTVVIRSENDSVSTISQNSRHANEFYNGSPEEHEDYADYFAQEITLKGVRVA